MMTPHIYLTVALAAGLLLSVTDARPAESSELKDDLEKTNAFLTKDEHKIDEETEHLPEELKEWGIPESVLHGVNLKKLQKLIDETIKNLPKYESEIDWSEMEKSDEEFEKKVVKDEKKLYHCAIRSLKSDPLVSKKEVQRIEKKVAEFVANWPEEEKELESPAYWKKVDKMALDWVKTHHKEVKELKQLEQLDSELDWHEIAKYEVWLADQATKYVTVCMKGEQYSIRLPLKKH